MIFGLFGGGGGNKKTASREEDDDEIEPIRFLGSLSGKQANLAANQRLADVGLVPAKELVTDALSRRAELIRLEPKGPAYVINFAVDGIAYPGPRMQKIEAVAVTQILKLLAGLDIKDRKGPQSGGVKGEFDGKQYHVMVHAVGVPDGERLTLKVLDPNAKLETPSEIGMSDDLRKKLRELCGQKPGALMVCGAPSTGTSTTLFGAVRGLDSYILSIFTFCDISGRKLVNITPFEAIAGDDLAKTITRCQRVEGDVLVLDPVKDQETAKVFFTGAEELLLVAEAPGKDAVSGVAQMVQWVGAEAVATSLKGMLSQRLIRVLCKDCKQAYKPNPDFLKKAGLPSTITNLYRKPAGGDDNPNVDVCDNCGGVGFKGRTGMFEFLEMSEAMKETIKGGGDVNAIRATMRAEKMLTLQQDALRLVAEGKTSLDEVQRIFKSA